MRTRVSGLVQAQRPTLALSPWLWRKRSGVGPSIALSPDLNHARFDRNGTAATQLRGSPNRLRHLRSTTIDSRNHLRIAASLHRNRIELMRPQTKRREPQRQTHNTTGVTSTALMLTHSLWRSPLHWSPHWQLSHHRHRRQHGKPDMREPSWLDEDDSRDHCGGASGCKFTPSESDKRIV